MRASRKLQPGSRPPKSSPSSSTSSRQILNWGLIQKVAVGRGGEVKRGEKKGGKEGGGGERKEGEMGGGGGKEEREKRKRKGKRGKGREKEEGERQRQQTRVVPAAAGCAAAPPGAVEEPCVPFAELAGLQGVGGEVADLQAGEFPQEIPERHPGARKGSQRC